MKYCKNCGTEIENEEFFCTECGVKQDDLYKENIDKYCENCGALREKKDLFCTECGMSFEADLTADMPAIDSKQLIGKRENNKKVIILIFALIMIVVAITVAIFAAKDNDRSENNIVESMETEFPETESNYEFNANAAVDLNEYIGYWVTNTAEEELGISIVDQNTVKFSIWIYRLLSIDDITANLKGNVAEFSYAKDDQYLNGYLTFGDSSISLTATDSNVPYFPIGTIEFNNWQSNSIENANEYYDSLTEKETVTEYSEPIINRVYCKVCGADCTYSKTINGMCINCYEAQEKTTVSAMPTPETRTVVVNGVAFSYQSSYPGCWGDGYINVSSIEIRNTKLDIYEFRVDGQTVNIANSAYAKFYEYDADGYLLNSGYLLFSLEGVFKESREIFLKNNTARVEIIFE